MIKLIKKNNNNVSFQIFGEEPLLQMLINALTLFAKKFGALTEVNGRIVNIYCPDSEVTDCIANFELE